MDFDTFVFYIKDQRAERVLQSRRRAGFTEAEVAEFQQMFNGFDADRSGSIEPREVGALLQSQGFSMKTAEERDTVNMQIEEARENALECFIKDVGQGGTITFPVLLQLLRILYNERDRTLLAREKAAIEEAKFDNGEVKNFREVFISWCEQERDFAQVEAMNEGIHYVDEDEPGDTPKEIKREGCRRFLLALGLKMSQRDIQELNFKLSELHREGKVDFSDFLRLMRWMMEVNFVNINSIFNKTPE
eukprot:TRINITY_DN8210_c0_g1_i4.p1 TRINITY_DN8210_c0_g1~~TRINITY_DN8210_c0_g1_i4.p1  ORF type:complete len:247 (-),score=103.84 TRINITY_DN8210_c0_g1_i4:162-902(-)